MRKLSKSLMNEDGPNAKSFDHLAMEPLWHQVTTILGGTDKIREESATYLPKFENETDLDYVERCKISKFTNVYRDIVENLSQKPFAREVQINEDAPAEIIEFCTDVDGKGNSIHTFAGEVFFFGINYAVEWILVDYTPDVPQNATRAQERSMGARPYWCTYRAEDVLFVESAMIAGREQFIHVRLRETKIIRSGWKQEKVDCIRIFNREPIEGADGRIVGYAAPTYEIWERTGTGAGQEAWRKTTERTPITIDEIPLVPFMTGRRKGSTWQFYAPMEDAADLQIELFQQESALKHIKSLAAFPMLAANGVRPSVGEDGMPEAVRVSPHTVLYAPPDGSSGSAGSWTFIEPNANSLRFLADDIKDTIKELRELGRQPLTAQTGNLTVVTTVFAAQKGNSAIQAWALNLKQALENCFWYTAKWMKTQFEIDVKIHTDFDLGMGDDDSFTHVLALRSSGEISRDALLDEAKRRGILNGDYDPEEDLERLSEDVEGEDADDTSALPGGAPGSEGEGADESDEDGAQEGA